MLVRSEPAPSLLFPANVDEFIPSTPAPRPPHPFPPGVHPTCTALVRLGPACAASPLLQPRRPLTAPQPAPPVGLRRGGVPDESARAVGAGRPGPGTRARCVRRAQRGLLGSAAAVPGHALPSGRKPSGVPAVGAGAGKLARRQESRPAGKGRQVGRQGKAGRQERKEGSFANLSPDSASPVFPLTQLRQSFLQPLSSLPPYLVCALLTLSPAPVGPFHAKQWEVVGSAPVNSDAFSAPALAPCCPAHPPLPC
eukprot:361158-Chlamydomonas_euryale.AAC.3